MVTLSENIISSALNEDSSFVKWRNQAKSSFFSLPFYGPQGFLLKFFLSPLFKEEKGPCLIIYKNEQEALELARELKKSFPHVYHFQALLPQIKKGLHTAAAALIHRNTALSLLACGEKVIVLSPLEALYEALPPASYFKSQSIHIKKAMEIDPQDFAKRLIDMGYSRVHRVHMPGEFALRGEVLDFYPFEEKSPLRLIYDFDQIQQLRSFNPGSQLTLEEVAEYRIFPLNDFQWTEQAKKGLEKYFPAEFNQKDLEEFWLSEAWKKAEPLLFASSFDNPAFLCDYFDDKNLRVLLGAEALDQDKIELEKVLKEEFQIDIELNDYQLSFQLPFYQKNPLTCLRRLLRLDRHFDNPQPDSYHFVCEKGQSYFGNINYLTSEIEALHQSGYQILIVSHSENQKKRLEYLFKDSPCLVIKDDLEQGFKLPLAKLCVICEQEIFSRRKRKTAASVSESRTRAIDNFLELNPGEYVVHVNYGIAFFIGIDRIKTSKAERDYIKLEYAEKEYIFVPVEQVNLIQKYIGGKGENPPLDKIGGKLWEKKKNKAKKAAEDLATWLLKVYSKRENSKGFACPPNTEWEDWQIKFEAAFPYQETEDQLKCIADVNKDMESPQVMDRLICGDVGYGKTEIAMRAVFKAIMSGKQAAVLTPTTLLAEQHFENFQERFAGFPFKIEMLSRFVPRAKQKKILEALKEAQVDILIGTHRILSKDIQYKELGLLVIDEEQRFGVKHKEKIKELKSSVDCLTLSATPIPRTLHMALLKIRDISVLKTAPANRQAVETQVKPFNPELIASAIRKEMDRGGQVFYLHNRVETLRNVQHFLERLVPEAGIESAHGQMSAQQLEDVMHRFVHGAFQVLLSTTIIENGIDIPNVNTIIIDAAHMYGLSQLYQLRGRVGRSDAQAHAYLFYPEEKSITENAMKRLNYISDFSELGSGFQIAMKDLEIRGAGNLLGREQSGNIMAVGFEMYLRLINEAILELQQKGEESEHQVFLELEYSGFIPDSYIDDPAEKFEIYRTIADVTTQEKLDDVTSFLADKYGPLPMEVESLIALAELRVICHKLFIHSIREKNSILRVEFGRVSRVPVNKVLRMISESKGKISLDPQKPNLLIFKTRKLGLKEKTLFVKEKLEQLLVL